MSYQSLAQFNDYRDGLFSSMTIETDDLMVIQWIQYYKGGVASQNGS